MLFKAGALADVIARPKTALWQSSDLRHGPRRGAVKSFGARLPKCPASSLHKNALKHIPEALWAALGPLLETIGSLTERIRDYERKLEEISKAHYPETELLRQVEGVGTLTALTFVLTLEDPYHFEKSRGAATSA
jgi:transposase